MNNIKFLFLIFSFALLGIFSSCSSSKNSGFATGGGMDNKGAFPAEYKSEKQFKMRKSPRRTGPTNRRNPRKSKGKDCDCPYNKKKPSLGMSLF